MRTASVSRRIALVVSVLLVVSALLAGAGCSGGGPDQARRGADTWPEGEGAWSRVSQACFLTVYGEDRSTWAPGAKPDDKWVTISLAFRDTLRGEFGLMTVDGFVPAAYPGVVATRMGAPPENILHWGFRPSEGGEVVTTEARGWLTVDASGGLDAALAVVPRLDRDYFRSALVHLDFDGDGDADLVAAMTLDYPNGFVPASCKDDN